VTAFTARCVRHGVGARLICQPDPRSGINTHPSPAAFPTTLSLPFLFPSFTFLHRPPSCLRPPQQTPLTSRRPPGPPPNRYDVASERNASAGPLALICSTPRQHYLVGRPTVRRPLAVTLMKRLALQPGAGDLITRRPEMQDHCYPPSRLANRPIIPPHVSTDDDNAASPLPPSFCRSPPRPVSSAGGGWGPAQITLRPGQ
jgi:hypothetical protein